MSEREKVIRALEWCIEKPCHPNCPYFTVEDESQARCLFTKILPDVLSLLKEQEARVMALDEIKKDGSSFVWAEIHSPHVQKMALIYCTVKQFEGWHESYLLSEESGVKWGRDAEDYNRDLFQGIHSGWRCWTARPTEEQRKAAAWDEEP